MSNEKPFNEAELFGAIGNIGEEPEDGSKSQGIELVDTPEQKEKEFDAMDLLQKKACH